ncbi:MAG TPA: TM2 domain-containing protein [Fibrobacteria bacterium]|nr:TM2 domain-containing protein [Fibrobacteria bacterium]HOX51312.1 TM2 domain-containing protein [Fibrobacteria bacterium]
MEDQTATIPVAKPAAPGVDKTALVLITLFLGGVGGHKFFLRKYFQGLLYALFCWTLIPGLISLVELVVYLSKSQSEIDARYPGVKGNPAAVALALGGGSMLLVVAGIVAALAIPRFLGATDKAKASECKPVLKQIATLEEVFYQEHEHYTTNIDSLGFEPPENASFEYRIEVDSPDRFHAKATLLRALGKAQPGEEVIYTLDNGLEAKGELGKLLTAPSRTFHHHDD